MPSGDGFSVRTTPVSRRRLPKSSGRDWCRCAAWARTSAVPHLRPPRPVSRNWKRCSTSPAAKEIVVAYEPVWAIGASAPAPAEYVADVCEHLRVRLESYDGRSRLLYGGSAGPGTYQSLGPVVDGLFLGRFAHDTRALAQVVTEVLTSGQSPAASPTSSKEHS